MWSTYWAMSNVTDCESVTSYKLRKEHHALKHEKQPVHDKSHRRHGGMWRGLQVYPSDIWEASGTLRGSVDQVPWHALFWMSRHEQQCGQHKPFVKWRSQYPKMPHTGLLLWWSDVISFCYFRYQWDSAKQCTSNALTMAWCIYFNIYFETDAIYFQQIYSCIMIFHQKKIIFVFLFRNIKFVNNIKQYKNFSANCN